MNFNTGYPKATLESVNVTDFLYMTSAQNVPTKVKTLTGNWAPIWDQEDRGEIRVNKLKLCNVIVLFIIFYTMKTKII